MSDNAANRSLPSVSVNPEGYQTIMGEEPLVHSNPGHAWRRMEARLTYEGDSTGGYDCSAQNSADVENRIESDPPQAAGAEVPSQCRPAISLESRGSLDRGCVVESCIRGGVAEDISTILGVKKSPPPHRSVRRVGSANPYRKKGAVLFSRTAFAQSFSERIFTTHLIEMGRNASFLPSMANSFSERSATSSGLVDRKAGFRR